MSASIRKLSQHSRSISLPSKSAPLKHQVEEHLCRLRLLELAASSSTSSSICRNLSGLQDLYDCVEDLLQSSLAKKSISHRDKKSLDKMLDASLKVLDFCGTTREILSEMKQSLQDLQSCVRRGGAESYVTFEVRSYMNSRKNGSKMIQKCLADMKKMEVKFARHGNCDIVTVLKDVGSIALAVFESLLSFISGTRTKSRGSNWSLVSKLIPSRGLACHGVEQEASEVLKANAALNALVGNTTSKDLDVRYIKEPLEALELSIQGIEDGLESLFRCLIKTRVSLLNILNQY